MPQCCAMVCHVLVPLHYCFNLIMLGEPLCGLAHRISGAGH